VTSIRRQLLLGQIGALILTGLLFSLITYTLAWDAFNRVRDYGLEQIAYSVLRHGVDTASDTDAPADEDKGQFLSQIWDTDGTLAYSSQEDINLPPQADGLHVVVLGKDEWRVYTLRQAGVTIQVANTTASRNRMFARIIPWLVLPLTVLVGLLGSFIWVAVGRALGPLERVRKEIGQRGAPSLHALETRGLPEEVAPLVSGLNDLLARLDAALTAQRRFVADAAHELRSPLTAVKLQAQIARQAQDPAERDAALRQLLDGVDRAAHMVEQLLRMARLAPEAQQVAFADVRLDELAKRVVGEFSAQAEAREIDLGVGECQSVTMLGHADSLRVMIGNLVDNALRYIPRGARVDVELRQTADQAVLMVSDNGPGIAPAERDRVFDRFYRLAGSEVPGSGLGLAIVKGVVELHGGRIRLDATEASGRGLKVTVSLPLYTP
jgi:two-component system OmpR family sensor kinase